MDNIIVDQDNLNFHSKDTFTRREREVDYNNFITNGYVTPDPIPRVTHPLSLRALYFRYEMKVKRLLDY